MTWLAKAPNTGRLFLRNQGFRKKKAKAVLLYMAGLSYHEITKVLHAVKCSHSLGVGQKSGADKAERAAQGGDDP